MSSPRLHLFDPQGVEPEHYQLPEERRLAGDPRQTVWPHYADATGRFSAGFWHSEVGTWRIAYTEEEFCHILEGVSIVTDDAGHATTLRAGDRFIVPAGFSGTWEVVEPTRKLYVIYEAAGAPP